MRRRPSARLLILDPQDRLLLFRYVVLSRDGWMEDEVNVIAEHKWWTRDEIANAQVQIWPDNILEMLVRAGR